MGILSQITDWLFGCDSGLIMPNGDFINTPNPQLAAQLMRQRQAMTPEEIMQHIMAGLAQNMITIPDKPWDGKLWYPLGDNYGH